MKVGFFLKEAVRSARRNPVPSFAAIASVLVTMLVLGVFIPVVQATTGTANEVRDRVLVNVYLKPTATDAEVERVRQLIVERTPNVKRVEYVSKEQAYRDQKARHREFFELLGSNPLPDTFRITPDDPDEIGKIRDSLTPAAVAGGRSPVDPAIDEVRNRKDDTQRILTITRIVKWTMAVLAILLILASVLLIMNTIRLSLYARRREVEVMKLVGATDWFIRWPFIIEGVVLGALGGIVSILLLAVGKVAFLDPLASDWALLAAPDTIGFGWLVMLLVAASVGVASVGSGLSLRRFLRV